MTNVAILGWGCAVPEHCVSQLQAAECLLAAAPPVIRQHEERWRRIFEHSRIRKRHTVVTRETLRQWQKSNLSGAENPLPVRGSTEARDVIPHATPTPHKMGEPVPQPLCACVPTMSMRPN
jgi:hypothetical protein